MPAHEYLHGEQFHEMARHEFEAQPGTMFHGHPTGNFNWDIEGRPQGFHVGTRRAAEEAVTARAAYGGYSDRTKISAPYKPTRTETQEGSMTTLGRWQAHKEQVRGGRIVSPMVNSPQHLGSYGKGDPGDMHDSGDSMANGRVHAINTRGQKMRQGIYYMNASEDEGSVSAVLPTRQSFKTHEDYLVEARAQGHTIPKRALIGYSQIPGQQKLF